MWKKKAQEVWVKELKFIIKQIELLQLKIMQHRDQLIIIDDDVDTLSAKWQKWEDTLQEASILLNTLLCTDKNMCSKP